MLDMKRLGSWRQSESPLKTQMKEFLLTLQSAFPTLFHHTKGGTSSIIKLHIIKYSTTIILGLHPKCGQFKDRNSVLLFSKYSNSGCMCHLLSKTFLGRNLYSPASHLGLKIMTSPTVCIDQGPHCRFPLTSSLYSCLQPPKMFRSL